MSIFWILCYHQYLIDPVALNRSAYSTHTQAIAHALTQCLDAFDVPTSFDSASFLDLLPHLDEHSIWQSVSKEDQHLILALAQHHHWRLSSST